MIVPAKRRGGRETALRRREDLVLDAPQERVERAMAIPKRTPTFQKAAVGRVRRVPPIAPNTLAVHSARPARSGHVACLRHSCETEPPPIRNMATHARFMAPVCA